MVSALTYEYSRLRAFSTGALVSLLLLANIISYGVQGCSSSANADKKRKDNFVSIEPIKNN